MAASATLSRRASAESRERSFVVPAELVLLIALSSALYLWGLARNGYANRYYSAAVRSMASNWHAFLYESFDPHGVMTVDKPPLALWIQTLSVRVFGFSPWSLLVPSALMGVATVWLVYDLTRRPFGRLAGFVAGLALVVTPITVAIARHNNPDALLVLCCAAALWCVVRGLERGGTRWIVLAGVAIGLGFEAKMLAALLVVPAIVVAWLWVAPRGRGTATLQLLGGGVAMSVVGLAWPVLMWLTPAAQRPWISGTSDNSIWSLIVGYNGFGRLFGQLGGPSSRARQRHHRRLHHAHHRRLHHAHHVRVHHGHRHESVVLHHVFSGPPGALRLLNGTLGSQAGWLIGVAVVGGLALLVLTRLRRTDPRTGWLLAVGGAFLTIAVAFSRATGIFHPYYVSLLAPFTAALVGAAAALIIDRGMVARVAGVAAVMATVVAEVAILRDPPGSLRWWQPLLILGGIAAAVSLWVVIRPQARALVMAGAIGLLAFAPAVWAAETIPHATGSTFPYGGPAIMAARHGISGPALTARSLKGRRARRQVSGALAAALKYARRHGGGTVAIASQVHAAAALLSGHTHVVAIGGFSGRETQVTTEWLAGLVRSGTVRYVLASRHDTIVGRHSRIGAADVLAAVRLVGRPVRAVHGLYDMRGRAGRLAFTSPPEGF